VGSIEDMNETNPDDRYGQDPYQGSGSHESDDPTRPISDESPDEQGSSPDAGFTTPDSAGGPSGEPAHEQPADQPPAEGAYGQPYGQPHGQPEQGPAGFGQPGYGEPTYGNPGYAPYGPYGYGGPGAPGGPAGPYGRPTPPRPSHASGPLMTPGDGGFGHGGFGHGGPPPYGPPRQKAPRGKRGTGVVVAAVLAGAVAGVAASAGYDALQPPESTTVVSSLQGSPASTEKDAPAPQGSVEQVAAGVLPSVVKIDVSSSQGQGSGSGIILSSDGLILTNNHVVALARGGGELAVSFNDGTTASATVVGTDPLTDLAVIKAEGVSGLKPATLGDSSNVDVGEAVVAVGSPFGLESTVTSGIVSATDRPVSAGDAAVGGQSTIFPAIQTDAAINPGNSGGALVDMNGNVIGINSAIRSTTTLGGEAGSIGLGFAIPVDEAKPIATELVNHQTPTHARLGVTVGTPENAEGLPGGAEVKSIENGTAAAGSGLQRGDVITRVDDNIISSSDSLVAIVRTYRPGEKVQVTFLRDGTRHTVTVVLGSDQGSNAS
jgi:putative serine protease PepD